MPTDHRLTVVPDPGEGVRTSLPRGSDTADQLVCGECGQVLALARRPRPAGEGLLRCPRCGAVNDTGSPAR
ncbi:hypothetical protein F1C76_13085 [Geodermatophilaceae bacterium NBWT11]|nr:hypothetical protein F1C76_13085 [Geodermatophilaceae bacterium NBWT11]